MADSEVLRMAGRLRVAKAELRRGARPIAAAPTPADMLRGDAFRAGDRAIDLVTGEEVEILGGGTIHTTVPATRRENP